MADNNRTVDTVKATNGETEVEMVRSAFDKVWADKGWTLVEDNQPVQQNAQAAQSPQTPAQPPQQAPAEPAAKKAQTDNR